MKFKQDIEKTAQAAPGFVYMQYREMEAMVKKYKYESDMISENHAPDEGQLLSIRDEFFACVEDNLRRIEADFIRQRQESYEKLKRLRSGQAGGGEKAALGYSTFSVTGTADPRVADYRSLYMHLLDLNRMRKVNREAARKIVKKFDKTSGENNQEAFMKESVAPLEFAKEDALKDIEEQMLADIRSALFSGRAGGNEEFQRFREAILLERQRRLEVQRNRFSIADHQTELSYLVAYSTLFLWLALYVQPRFTPNPANNWMGYAVIFGVLTGVLMIALHNKPADVSLMTINILFLTSGIITAEEAFAGFSNAGVIANGILLPFARALSMAGGAELCLMKCLGKPESETAAVVRMCFVVAALSSVLNNTPIVFMMIPILQVWCSRLDMSVSKFMMPMSFAIMLGGTCSIVGSSANLVTIGIASTYHGKFAPGTQPEYNRPGFWSPAVIGLPVCMIGVLWMAASSRLLLPKRIPAAGERALQSTQQAASTRESGGLRPSASMVQTPAVFTSSARFEVAFRVVAPLVGNTVEETGLTRIGPKVLRIRNVNTDESTQAVPQDELEPPFDGSPWLYRLRQGDVVTFLCSSEQVNKVRQTQGLVLHNKHINKVVGDRRDKSLLEVTVGPHSTLEGKSLVDVDFRRKYNACCVALYKSPKNKSRKSTDFKRQPLHEGDVLLLEVVKKQALSQFVRLKMFNSMVVIENSAPPMRDTRNMVLTMGSLLLLVVLTSLEIIDIVALGFLIVAAFIALRVITPKEAWASLKGDVLLTIAASFGIGQAMSNSGIAMWIGELITVLCKGSEFWVLALVYGFTVFLGLFLNNASVAVLVYPVAYSACVENAGIDPELVVLLIIMGAGLSFTTPMSYQTNQMVQGPGGYKFFDFVSFGGSLQVATGVASVVVLYFLAQAGFVKHHHALWTPPAP